MDQSEIVVTFNLHADEQILIKNLIQALTEICHYDN